MPIVNEQLVHDTGLNLRVVDVFEVGNETGWVTPPVLYNPAVRGPRSLRYPNGQIMAPRKEQTIAWADHGTVGINTLMFWGNGGSVSNGSYSLAKYLVPHEWTRYRDGLLHDTSLTVFKLTPDWAACNHLGPATAPFRNENTVGVEYESLQNGTHDISEMQYIKGALLYTFQAAWDRIRDYYRIPHGLVALPWGRRSDPWAGKFDIAYSWEIVQCIRRDAAIWQKWGLPQPERGF